MLSMGSRNRSPNPKPPEEDRSEDRPDEDARKEKAVQLEHPFAPDDGDRGIAKWSENEMGPEQAVEQLVERAASMDASDIFLVNVADHIEVTVRQLGIPKVIGRLSASLGNRCMGHIRAVAGLDFVEKRRPQDGRWVHSSRDGSIVDLRLNTMPTMYGESIAMRLLIRNPDLQRPEMLGMLRPQLGDLLSALHTPGGLILVTGPTGSGKTTTLYACLHHLNDGRQIIHTIEDPIEYAVPGLRQSQVDESNGATFADLIRAVVRQGPDVIMIGEIRDRTTAETAVRAANGGQLVFATVHAPFAAGAMQSMFGLGVPAHFLASSLLAVVSQRLVRTLNPETRIPVDLSAASGAFADVRPWIEETEGNVVYAASSHDGDDGYTGRSGLFEVMTVSPNLRRMIAEMQPGSAIAKQAVDDGMIDLRRSAYVKVAQGLTSFDEIQRVLPRPEEWEWSHVA
jgi:type II secretory ATPase GspE/PulE/Tfp pilus assembly ATPase PilB-like protein